MHFTFTPPAIERLAEYLNGGERQLKLHYDTEGCGCVVSGVPVLQVLGKPEQGDVLGTGEPYAVWFEPQYEVFFEPQLRIDYNPARSSFILKSDNQTYTTNMRLLT